jgi:hypothetical protein
MTGPGRCPCGAELAVPVTGRRPRWCSKACRQAAYRARLAAGRAAGETRWAHRELARAGDRGQEEGLAREFSAAASTLTGLLRRLYGLPPATAVRLPGPAGWTGWENDLITAAREVAALADQAGELARLHARAAADYAAARRMAGNDPGGLRRAPAPRLGGDKSRAGCVAPRAAAPAATKHKGEMEDSQ